jgi:hypothetical protein
MKLLSLINFYSYKIYILTLAKNRKNKYISCMLYILLTLYIIDASKQLVNMS